MPLDHEHAVVMRRHRVVCFGLLVIAVALLETSVDHYHGWSGRLAVVATMLPALLVLPGSVRGGSPAILAAGAATSLLAQTILATIEFGGGVQPTTLLLTMLAVVASYRTQRALVVAGIVAAVGQLLLVLLFAGPFDIATHAVSPNDDSSIVSLVSTWMGAWALVQVWRDHRVAQRLASERDQISSTYRDVLPMVSIRLDRTGRILDVNRKTCLLLDMEWDDIVGRDWFDLALPEEYRAPGRDYFERAAAGSDVLGEEVQAYTNEIVGADGVRRTVEWSAGWIVDADGTRTSLLGVGRDITDELLARAEADRSRHEMDALRHLAQKVASLDDSRQAVVDAAGALTGACFAAIAEPDRERTTLTTTIASEPEAVGATVDVEGGSARAEAYRTARTRAFEPGAEQGSTAIPADAAWVVHQPIIGADGTLGVLTLAWNDAGGARRDREHQLAALVAHEASISLRRRDAIGALERAALTDPLTGVSNRRAFDAELPAALRRAEATDGPFSLVILDLNAFKAVNDTEGHEAGDALLARCAAAWSGVLRRGDLLARLGGDEFAVLLPTCSAAELPELIARIRSATPHAPGTAIGGATWIRDESAAQLIRRADADQYADKARCHAALAARSRSTASERAEPT